jgi:hypothetical protein
MPESLATSRFSALKGPRKVAQGRGSEATAALGMGRKAVGPLSPRPLCDRSKPLPDAGRGVWGVGQATNSLATPTTPLCQASSFHLNCSFQHLLKSLIQVKVEEFWLPC